MDALVFDTSVILNFGQRGHLQSLLERFGRVYRLVTTPAVVGELTDPAQRAFNDRLVKSHFDLYAPTAIAFDLETLRALSSVIDPGEVSVILVAAELQGMAVIDEKAGRREAEKLRIRIIGTLGLLHEAFKMGWISDAECSQKLALLKAKGFNVKTPHANQTFEEFFRQFE